MKLPLSWLREFAALPASLTPTQVEQALVGVGFEVEQIQGGGITGPLVVAAVVSIEAVEGQKKPIRYVGLNCGEAQTRFVICGANNFVVGDLVVAALPGAVLPGDFAIAARKTYGHISDGMICSARELGISDEHSGIIILPAGSANPGDDAVLVLELDDLIIDASINPDRGYALSARGLARELALALNVEFTDPAASDYLANHAAANGPGVGTKILATDGADLIIIRTIDGVDVSRATPTWMRRRIEKSGMRSISLVVDITNYVMLELGQPLHAFDADQIAGDIQVKRPDAPGKFTTLDGVEREIDQRSLMIGDDQKFLALAGTMGGLNSEVTGQTKRIALEAAHFTPMAVAVNSRLHKLSSEASRRLERYVDAEIAEIASARATALIVELAGGSYVHHARAGAAVALPPVEFTPAQITSRIGYEYSDEQIESALNRIGLEISKRVNGVASDYWIGKVPSWRPDLKSSVDLSEEVARVYGYDLIPLRLPRSPKSGSLSTLQLRKREVAKLLANIGFTEVYNFPFVNQATNDALGFVGPRAATFALANPMSDQEPLLRTHLIPGLIAAFNRNLSRGLKEGAIFEIGTVFRNAYELTVAPEQPTDRRPSAAEQAAIYGSVPPQPLFVGAIAGPGFEPSGWWGQGRAFDWSDAIAIATRIAGANGAKVGAYNVELAPWHPGRCAEITADGQVVAHAGELHPRVIEHFGLPERTCIFAVILSALPDRGPASAPVVSAFPLASQDLAIVVPTSVVAAELQAVLAGAAGDYLEKIELFDRFELGGGEVSLAFKFTFRAPDRTLTQSELSTFREAALAAAVKAFGAKSRS